MAIRDTRSRRSRPRIAHTTASFLVSRPRSFFVHSSLLSHRWQCPIPLDDSSRDGRKNTAFDVSPAELDLRQDMIS